MLYIDATWPTPGGGPPLVPPGSEDAAFTAAILAEEDSLHADMRTLTFGFVLPRAIAAKPPEKLELYDTLGPADDGRAAEVSAAAVFVSVLPARDSPMCLFQVAWWRRYALDGISAGDAKAALRRYEAAVGRLEARLAGGPGGSRRYLCGDHITVADVACAINVNRLELCGQPLTPCARTLSCRDRSSAVFFSFTCMDLLRYSRAPQGWTYLRSILASPRC